MKNTGFEQIVRSFIAAANNFDTQTVLDLFTPDGVIEDVSVGEKFQQEEGIRKYFVTFFIGYHTSTQLLSVEETGSDKILAKVDFTGDFGHETGGLAIHFNETGLIKHIEAYLD
ncbi:nuclear transport factor 2 family protein [Pedobacter sp. 22163]|uniref:nuclear transport factor 2 family protein n=1 Tax=Pedobacter sp. 22163 TaxID=3453883 RepID=UPI003F827A5E